MLWQWLHQDQSNVEEQNNVEREMVKKGFPLTFSIRVKKLQVNNNLTSFSNKLEYILYIDS